MIDLSQEQEQKSAYGPVPSGSRVLVRLTIEKPRYASPGRRTGGHGQNRPAPAFLQTGGGCRGL